MTDEREFGVFDINDFYDYLWKRLTDVGFVPDEASVSSICDFTLEYLDQIGAENID